MHESENFLLQCMKVKSFSRVRLLATPWTAAYQAPPSMGFSRQEYWSGVPSPSPTMQETWVNPWVGKISWRRDKLPTPVFWSGEFNRLYSPWGRKESTGLSDFHFHFSAPFRQLPSQDPAAPWNGMQAPVLPFLQEIAPQHGGVGVHSSLVPH